MARRSSQLNAGGSGGPAPGRRATYARSVFTRSGVDRLPIHLEAAYGIQISRLEQLDVGVFRADRQDGPGRVARLFPA